jgi:drug/metabolite transporter (DMT)-like permease
MQAGLRAAPFAWASAWRSGRPQHEASVPTQVQKRRTGLRSGAGASCHGCVHGRVSSGHSQPRLARLLLWVVPAMWSCNYIIARLSPGEIHPHVLALGRWTLALALMLPFVWAGWRRQAASFKREWPHLLVLGGLGMWICGAFVYQGAHTTSALNIALIYSATPVAIAVCSVKLLHERMSRAQGLGVAIALCGVLFIIARGDPANLLAVRFSVGDGWILVAAVSWTAYSVLLRFWPSPLGPLERLAAVIAGGIVVLLPFTALEAFLLPPLPWSAKGVGLIVLAAVVPGLLSYGAYSFLQRELGASRTALMLYLAPVYGALLGWLILGERPGWFHAVGAAMILPSIALATRK